MKNALMAMSVVISLTLSASCGQGQPNSEDRSGIRREENAGQSQDAGETTVYYGTTLVQDSTLT